MPKDDVGIVEGMEKNTMLIISNAGGKFSGHNLAWTSVRLGKHHFGAVPFGAENFQLRYIFRHRNRHRDTEKLSGTSEPLGKIPRREGHNAFFALGQVQIIQSEESSAQLEGTRVL